MADLKINPTGCPGPIPGTHVWRCDGTSCVYGPMYYDSCRKAIAERGYELRISSDLVEEAAQTATLHEQTAQGRFEKERQDRLKETKEHLTAMARKETELSLSQSERLAVLEEMSNIVTQVSGELSEKDEQALLQQQVMQEHITGIECALAELMDELNYCKYVLAARSQPTAEEGSLVEPVGTPDEAGPEESGVLTPSEEPPVQTESQEESIVATEDKEEVNEEESDTVDASTGDSIADDRGDMPGDGSNSEVTEE